MLRPVPEGRPPDRAGDGLQAISHAYALLANYGEAIAYFERSLAKMQTMGERAWESAVWDSLGYIHHHRGDFRQAIACYERAIGLARELADRFNEADTLTASATSTSAPAIPPRPARPGPGLCGFSTRSTTDRDQIRASSAPMTAGGTARP